MAFRNMLSVAFVAPNNIPEADPSSSAMAYLNNAAAPQSSSDNKAQPANNNSNSKSSSTTRRSRSKRSSRGKQNKGAIIENDSVSTATAAAAAAPEEPTVAEDGNRSNNSSINPAAPGVAVAAACTPQQQENDAPPKKQKRTRRRKNRHKKSSKKNTSSSAAAQQALESAVQQQQQPHHHHQARPYRFPRNQHGMMNQHGDTSSVASSNTSSLLYACLKVSRVGIGGNKLTVARVTILDWSASIVLDQFVQVPVPVQDYHGIPPWQLEAAHGAISFQKVRQQVVQFIRGKIVVGHGVQEDLQALAIGHSWTDVRDTAKYPKFAAVVAANRPPLLEELTQIILKRDLHPKSSNNGGNDDGAPSPINTNECKEDDKTPNQQEDEDVVDPRPRSECIAALDLYKTFRSEWEQDLIDHYNLYHVEEETAASDYQSNDDNMSGRFLRTQLSHEQSSQHSGWSASSPNNRYAPSSMPRRMSFGSGGGGSDNGMVGYAYPHYGRDTYSSSEYEYRVPPPSNPPSSADNPSSSSWFRFGYYNWNSKSSQGKEAEAAAAQSSQYYYHNRTLDSTHHYSHYRGPIQHRMDSLEEVEDQSSGWERTTTTGSQQDYLNPQEEDPYRASEAGKEWDDPARAPPAAPPPVPSRSSASWFSFRKSSSNTSKQTSSKNNRLTVSIPADLESSWKSNGNEDDLPPDSQQYEEHLMNQVSGGRSGSTFRGGDRPPSLLTPHTDDAVGVPPPATDENQNGAGGNASSSSKWFGFRKRRSSVKAGSDDGSSDGDRDDLDGTRKTDGSNPKIVQEQDAFDSSKHKGATPKSSGSGWFGFRSRTKSPSHRRSRSQGSSGSADGAFANAVRDNPWSTSPRDFVHNDQDDGNHGDHDDREVFESDLVERLELTDDLILPDMPARGLSPARSKSPLLFASRGRNRDPRSRSPAATDRGKWFSFRMSKRRASLERAAPDDKDWIEEVVSQSSRVEGSLGIDDEGKDDEASDPTPSQMQSMGPTDYTDKTSKSFSWFGLKKSLTKRRDSIGTRVRERSKSPSTVIRSDRPGVSEDWLRDVNQNRERVDTTSSSLDLEQSSSHLDLWPDNVSRSNDSDERQNSSREDGMKKPSLEDQLWIQGLVGSSPTSIENAVDTACLNPSWFNYNGEQDTGGGSGNHSSKSDLVYADSGEEKEEIHAYDIDTDILTQSLADSGFDERSPMLLDDQSMEPPSP